MVCDSFSDGYMKQQNYRKASRVYYKGAEIFDGMRKKHR